MADPSFRWVRHGFGRTLLMQKNITLLGAFTALVFCGQALAGCNIGNAPSGPSQAEYQKTLDSMTPPRATYQVDRIQPAQPRSEGKTDCRYKG